VKKCGGNARQHASTRRGKVAPEQVSIFNDTTAQAGNNNPTRRIREVSVGSEL